MGNQWFRKVSVQSALVTGVFAFVTGLVALVGVAIVQFGPKTTLEAEIARRDLEITRLRSELGPFKAVAIQRFGGTEHEALAKLSTQLAELQAASQLIGEKLKRFEEQTTSITNLPDGRVKVGDTVTGVPAILQKRFSELATLFDAGSYEEAYAAAKECITMIEQSEEQTESATALVGISPDGRAYAYYAAAMVAQRNNDHAQALRWARVAAGSIADPEFNALLVAALWNMHRFDEAAATIQKHGAGETPEAQKFRGLIHRMGLRLGAD